MLTHFLAVAYPPNKFTDKIFRSCGHDSGFIRKFAWL
jgi:hypothetical protein